VSCLTVCSDTVMIGTAAGLSVMHHDSVSVVSSRLLGRSRIFKIEPEDSNFWIATNFGALRIKRSTGEVATFEDPLKMTYGRVYDIVHRGRFLWMSTDNGLLRVNLKTAGTEPYRITLFPNVVRRLAVNDLAAAVASDRGLTLVHYARAKPIYREFTVADGLPSDHINCLLFDGDFLWIGSDAGLTRFWWNNPDRVD
jgi:ligand-binding sensor domain-containing protein